MHQAQPQTDKLKTTQEEQDRAREFAAFVHMTDYQIYVEKQRRDEARREAEERGLDGAEREHGGLTWSSNSWNNASPS